MKLSKRVKKIIAISMAIMISGVGGPVSLVFALPQGGEIVGGPSQGSINQPSAQDLHINQNTNNLIINWQGFNIGQAESVQFFQPGIDSIALNRVSGIDPSRIAGRLSANGQIFISNPSGVIFLPGSQVNVHGLLSTTLSITDQDFLDRNYRFYQDPTRSLASILNEGAINASYVGLLAPSVINRGSIVANLGSVALASGKAATLDFIGDNLINFAITEPVEGTATDSEGNVLDYNISNEGLIRADGGQVSLSVKRAGEIVKNVINQEGLIEARTVVEREGRIFLSGGDNGGVRITGTLDASVKEVASATEATTNGSASPVETPQEESANVDAKIPEASGAPSVTEAIANATIEDFVQITGDAQSEVVVEGARVIIDGGQIFARGTEKASAGNISITALDLVSLGGTLDASGYSGGDIAVDAGRLSLAAPVLAKGSKGKGGNVSLKTKSSSFEFTAGLIDVSGSTGGTITNIGDGQILTSAKYLAQGTQGAGGKIDVTAPTLKFLSGAIDASGLTDGGLIRLGGELQGGKDLTVDEIPNAQYLAMLDGTRVNADSTGTDGDGGTVIVWSDQVGTVLGQFSALPGTETGEGGFLEVSSGNKITFAGTAVTGIGDRLGTVLLDPKNVIIGTASTINQLSLILSAGFTGGNVDVAQDGKNLSVSQENKNIDQTLDSIDTFGFSVSLDGTRLAVGSNGDGGVSNTNAFAGAVYLYSFTDSVFSGGVLEAIIGSGYTGGKNIDQTLDVNDLFGESVSLDGNRLAVGTVGDDGFNNSGTAEEGAVYLYSFTDSAFTGGNLEAIIGEGYNFAATGRIKDIDLALDSIDLFGRSVSLDGNRLAIGANGDDGFNNSGIGEEGAVYLYSFTDNAFSGGNLEAIIGEGYNFAATGRAKDIDQPLDGGVAFDTGDAFGRSVSLDGNRLAVGADGDDGVANGNSNAGAVYLFSFTDSAFNGGVQEAIIGSGFTGGKNIDQTLDFGDNLGISVSLDGNRLAVGVNGDDGIDGGINAAGAVRLYSFTDDVFSGGSQEAIIGAGFTGGKNVSLDLDNDDQFGFSVSLDGNRLASGARGVDEENGPNIETGAVGLFTFSDNLFNNGSLEAIIGSGFVGGTQTLDTSDGFGSSVSLDGNRLAVGAFNDDGTVDTSGTLSDNEGAVYLYTFTDSAFSGGVLESIIGSGFTGGKNIDPDLDSDDQFGASVSLDGNRLAVGAQRDDGATDITPDGGAVYLFSFSDSTFSGGNLEAIIGEGFTGGKNIDENLLMEINLVVLFPWMVTVWLLVHLLVTISTIPA